MTSTVTTQAQLTHVAPFFILVASPEVQLAFLGALIVLVLFLWGYRRKHRGHDRGRQDDSQ